MKTKYLLPRSNKKIILALTALSLIVFPTAATAQTTAVQSSIHCSTLTANPVCKKPNQITGKMKTRINYQITSHRPQKVSFNTTLKVLSSSRVKTNLSIRFFVNCVRIGNGEILTIETTKQKKNVTLKKGNTIILLKSSKSLSCPDGTTMKPNAISNKVSSVNVSVKSYHTGTNAELWNALGYLQF